MLMRRRLTPTNKASMFASPMYSSVVAGFRSFTAAPTEKKSECEERKRIKRDEREGRQT